MEIRCIHTGDLHLGMEFKNASFDSINANKRRIELWESFNRIIDRCNEIKAHLLLIAGDLFEEEYCTIGDIKRISNSFKELKNTRVIISAGNHDSITKNSLYKLIEWGENVHILDTNNINKVKFMDINTTVWGLSWDKKEERRSLAENIDTVNYDDINILLIHGDVINKDSNYLPLDKKSLVNSDFDYIALGHIHKYMAIDKKICYCGSPEPLDFGETGEHGIIEGAISKGKIDMSFKAFSKRKFKIVKINIDAEMTLENIISKILDCDIEEKRNKDLYRIILDGVRDKDLELNISDLKSYLDSHFNYIEIEDNTTPDYDLDLMESQNINNIIGHYIREMKMIDLNDPVTKKALLYGLEVLINEKVKK